MNKIKKIIGKIKLLATEIIPKGHDWNEWTKAYKAYEKHNKYLEKLLSLH